MCAAVRERASRHGEWIGHLDEMSISSCLQRWMGECYLMGFIATQLANPPKQEYSRRYARCTAWMDRMHFAEGVGRSLACRSSSKVFLNIRVIHLVDSLLEISVKVKVEYLLAVLHVGTIQGRGVASRLAHTCVDLLFTFKGRPYSSAMAG